MYYSYIQEYGTTLSVIIEASTVSSGNQGRYVLSLLDLFQKYLGEEARLRGRSWGLVILSPPPC